MDGCWWCWEVQVVSYTDVEGAPQAAPPIPGALRPPLSLLAATNLEPLPQILLDGYLSHLATAHLVPVVRCGGAAIDAFLLLGKAQRIGFASSGY